MNRTSNKLYDLKKCLYSVMKFLFLERGCFHSQMNLGALPKPESEDCVFSLFTHLLKS